MNFASWDHTPLSHAMPFGHWQAPEYHHGWDHSIPFVELQNLNTLNLQGLGIPYSSMIELDETQQREYTLDLDALEMLEDTKDEKIDAGDKKISVYGALKNNMEYKNALQVQKRLLNMVKQNIFDFIELFQIRSLISIDDLCGIHFKLTHIPKNMFLSKEEHLKHQQSIVFSFMLVKSIMDNFLLSDFANAITVENKDFVHNM